MVSNLKKLDFIDALRGYAILLVIFAHTGQMHPLDYPNIFQSLINFGPRGVQLFFLVSALTLFLTSEKRFGIDKRPYLSFFTRRFFRIAPLFYSGLLFYNLFSNDKITLEGIFANLFFIDAINPSWQSLYLVPGSWSISAEMIFYLFFPILFLKIKSLNQSVWFTIISLIFAVILKIIFLKFSFGYNLNIWGSFVPYVFPFSIPVFGIGICFFFIIFKKDCKVGINALLASCVIILLMIIFEVRFLYTYFIVILFGLIASALSNGQSFLSSNFLIKYFGKISFSMYMVHFGIIEALNYFGLHNLFAFNNSFELVIYFLVKFILVIVFTLFFSTLTFFSIESIGQKLGNRVVKYINR